jgi:hypothetical protein
MNSSSRATENPNSPQASRAEDSQRGYALLLVMFFTALLVLTVSIATPNLLTQARREKEAEMIWRGNQYVRGVRLYYQKMHRFPTKLEDLYKPKTGIRFMRKAYRDPMNIADGSWRLICVGPDGRLIGSLKPQRNTFFFGARPATGLTDSLTFSSPSSMLASPNSIDTTGKASQRLNSPADSATPGQTPSETNSSLQSLATSADENQVTNNVIVGVGSKIDKRSIMWLDGERNYLQFEFVWNGQDEVIKVQ